MPAEPPPGGEPLWIAPKKPRYFSLEAPVATRSVKQAAPANVSTRSVSPELEIVFKDQPVAKHRRE
jgi:hypothetical protein